MYINDLAITSLETITAFDVTTGSYVFTLDELQNASIAQAQETTDITGKQGRVISTLKKNKTVTVSGTNGLVSGGLLETQTGGTFENKAIEVLWADYLTVTSHTATTSYKAIGTAGAEIEALYAKNNDGTLGNLLTQQAEASAPATFAYNPTTKALSFYDNVPDGTEIIVYYKRNIVADTLGNDAGTYSSKLTLYIDALAEDKCGNIYRVQFYIPKADFSGEFTLELGDNQTTHAFEAKALAGGCGGNGQLWSYTIFSPNTLDHT